jgi:hypothetical protein
MAWREIPCQETAQVGLVVRGLGEEEQSIRDHESRTIMEMGEAQAGTAQEGGPSPAI